VANPDALEELALPVTLVVPIKKWQIIEALHKIYSHNHTS